jgi:hypothetical protein
MDRFKWLLMFLTVGRYLLRPADRLNVPMAVAGFWTTAALRVVALGIMSKLAWQFCDAAGLLATEAARSARYDLKMMQSYSSEPTLSQRSPVYPV